MKALIARLETSGFERVPTVREVGEFAVRGGILDLFAPGADEAAAARLLRRHAGDDPRLRLGHASAPPASATRSTLQPMSEVALTPETISRFRRNYIEAFGAPSRDDALYAAVSEGRRFAGMEHWLPFFYERLDTLFDYLPDAPVVFDHLAREALAERHTLILDYYEARRQQAGRRAQGRRALQAVPPEPALSARRTRSPRRCPTARRSSSRPSTRRTPARARCLHAGRAAGRSFAEERADPNANVFDAVVKHIADGPRGEAAQGRRRRLDRRLARPPGADACRASVSAISSRSRRWPSSRSSKPGRRASPCCRSKPASRPTASSSSPSRTFSATGWCAARRSASAPPISSPRRRRSSAGDLVVHVDHGIGRFVGLKTIEAAGAPHDCLEIHYAGDDRLFLPVENIELLSRYGSEGTEAVLDKLGGGAWQSRKAKLKKRLRDMAGQLIRIAAERLMRTAPALQPAGRALRRVLRALPLRGDRRPADARSTRCMDDLSAGRPMDRLICGDVGFGKTEVALRAAFVAAMEGMQVAVVVPTTLLARQHFKTFSQRFRRPAGEGRARPRAWSARRSSPRPRRASPTARSTSSSARMRCSAAPITFKNLGLLIVDEEQHFGVKHKERLKELKADVHVLTLSATPIPRTLQLALTGVRELSLIATPPVDRLAVRTFISPFDPLVIREALLRERYRGGQSFYVVPRIADLAGDPGVPARSRCRR